MDYKAPPPDIDEPPQMDLSMLRNRAASFARNARATATDAAYQSDWADFVPWCEGKGLSSLPASPETVALYLSDRAHTLKTSTLQRRLAAIVVIHHREGHPFDSRAPVLAEVWRGIRRSKGVEKVGKAPLLQEDLKGIVDCLPRNLAGKRDRALLLLGFSGAFRRSELAGLDVEDLTFTSKGMVVRLHRQKNDQEGKGSLKAIPRDQDGEEGAVAAVKDWIMSAYLNEGPLFRAIDRLGRLGAEHLDGRSVARIVKKAVSTYGEKQGWSHRRVAEEVKRVAGHSLRSGYATSAAISGVPEWAIMRQTGHRRRDSLQPYIRLGAAIRAATTDRNTP